MAGEAGSQGCYRLWTGQRAVVAGLGCLDAGLKWLH